MNTHPRLLALVLTGATATASFGQTVISSFHGNGVLSWTNAVNSNSLYRVEWAAQATGPWYRTFDNLGSLDGLSETGFTVAVPMFFRVAVATNPPPTGMVWIEGSDAELGQYAISTPVHTSYISGFWMDATEVTKAQWDDVANWAATNGYDLVAGDASGKTNNHPVYNVTWYEGAKWCNARSEKEGLTPCYYTDVFFFNAYRSGNVDLRADRTIWNSGGYRLPTESEWEKAARGGHQERWFPWGGDKIQHTRANYFADTNDFSEDTSETQNYHPNYKTSSTPYTSPVGSFPANAFGLHDMAGNVNEWCWDWYNGIYSAAYAVDPRGSPTGSERMIRGGAWDTVASGNACAARTASGGPAGFDDNLGFRCVRGP